MKNPTKKLLTAAIPAALATALAAFVNTSQAVDFTEMTNGLVDYYPLNQVDTNSGTTIDLVSRRDMTLNNMTVANIVSDTHPGIETNVGPYVFNFNQSGGPTVCIYQSTGQNPADGSGDFLPVINQRGAAMNFWIKGPVPTAADLRVYGECANNGDSGSFFSLSSQPATKVGLGFFLRLNGQSTDPYGNTVNQMPDGSYETPSYFYVDSQSSQYTLATIFDSTWHNFTFNIETNGDVHVFVDGNFDVGGTPANDNEGNPSIAPPMAVTNSYYNTTNTYPVAGPYFGLTNGQNPGFYVRWMVPGDTVAGAFSCIGGYDRNGSIVAGPVCEMSDFGFWNRTLTTNETLYILTNGIGGTLLPNTNVMRVLAFYPVMPEVGVSRDVILNWNVLGATQVNISGIGNNVGSQGSATNVLGANSSYAFTLTAINGQVANVTQTINVKTVAGEAKNWREIQRFDGVYATTTAGIEDFPGDLAKFGGLGGTWFDLSSIYSGALDRFNVVSLPTGGQSELVLSPKSGYYLAGTSPIGYDTRGAIAYGYLNNWSIPPLETHTAFFRFAVRQPDSLGTNYYSGMDFGFGLTDFGFATGPLGGETGLAAVGAQTIGPGFKIAADDSTGLFGPEPFDLIAANYSGSNYLTGYDYMTDGVNGNPNGLTTNATYMVWMDVSNDATAGVGYGTGTTNTVKEPLFSVWLQGPGQTNPVQLFSGFGGNRDWSQQGINNDNITNILNKVFVSIASEDFVNGDSASFFETNNMIVLDDFYLSKSGYDHTLPRPLAIQSIVRGASTATIRWYSLGSLYQTNTYSVQRTPNLQPGYVWTTIATGVPSGGDFTSYTDPAPLSPMGVYRILWP